MSGALIIGGGQAGARAAVELRKAGFKSAINILAEENMAPYERPPLSKDVLIRGAVAGEPQVVPLAEFEARDIGLHLSDRVTELNAAGKRVSTASGKEYVYDYLVVATGASARRLNVPGADLDGVLTLRDALDAVRLRARLSKAKRVAIIGGGVLGLEVAASARALNVQAVVLEQSKNCLERVLPAQAVLPIIDLHVARGATILCDAKVASITGVKEPTEVILENGERIDCNLVVVAIGSVPNDAIVAAGGGECAGGVLIDEQCCTSLPDVFAVGDVALDRSTRVRRESWENANRHAAIAASTITGAEAPVNAPPWFWSDQYDLNLQVLGSPRSGDTLVERLGSSARQRVQFYLRSGAVEGAVLFDSGRDRRIVAQLIGTKIDPALLASSRVPLKMLV